MQDIRRVGFILAIGLTVSFVANPPAVAQADFPAYDSSVFADGLEQPDGLAFHPVSGELYVSEEAAGRVSVIRNGHGVPVLTRGFQVRPDFPEELVTAELPRTAWLQDHLRSPEGIAFGPDHRLYVAEDAPRGRVLKFEADATGHYRTAEVIPLPQLGEPYAWESLCFARDGRLFLSGSSYEGSQTWGYGCVLARDVTQSWWMVDFGPLASFSAIAMAEDEQVLIAGDESVGSLTWWDVDRQREIQTLVNALGSIEGLCVLPDGSVVAALEHAKDGGKLVRVDPASGELTVIASELGTLESVICEPRTGKLYVTEDSTGRILCFTPRHALTSGKKIMQVTRRSSEARRGLPPRETPSFLKQFMRQVGVDLVDQSSAAAHAPRTQEAKSMTLEELGKRIPLVAGRVKVEELPNDTDPIVEVNFLSLFPNQIIHGEQTTPSLCLFSARHRSGRIERSEIWSGKQARRLRPDGGWENLSEPTLLMTPLSTCSAVENANGVSVTLAFMGLGQMQDYFLTLNYGRSNEAFFASSGEDLRVARATFSEQRGDGREVLNFAMSGVRTRRVEEATWMPLGPHANWTLLSPGVDSWVSRRSIAVMPDLVAKLRRYNHDVIDALLAEAPGEPPGTITKQPKPESATESKPAQQAEQSPSENLSPLADLRMAPPNADEEQNLTNIILSQIVRAWDKGWRP